MKAIPDLDGYYATEEGTIVSMRGGSPRLLRSRLHRGYLVVTLKVVVKGEKTRRPKPVHRLVLLAFAGMPIDGMDHGRHLNGNALDNRPINLAWGDALLNARDALRHGTLGPGMRARHRRLSEQQVRSIVARRRAGESAASLANEFGVCEAYPDILSRGKTWGHLDLADQGA